LEEGHRHVERRRQDQPDLKLINNHERRGNYFRAVFLCE